MTFEAANTLLDEITNFLKSCGGVYKTVSGITQENIMVCLVSGQYVYYPNKYFACFFKVTDNDIEGLKERVRPLDVFTGKIFYIAEAASRNRFAMYEMVKAIRAKGRGCKGVFWHRPAKQDKVYFFPSQHGTEDSDGEQ